MKDNSTDILKRSAISPALDESIRHLKTLFSSPENADLRLRDFRCGDIRLCAIYMDGLADEDRIGDFIIRPLQGRATDVLLSGDSAAKAIADHIIEVSGAETASIWTEAIAPILTGKTCLLIDGCAEALILDTLKPPHRGIDKPEAESVICGSHEAYTEHLRTNLSMLRRYVQSENLICESMKVGMEIPTGIAIAYLKGVANEKCISEVKRRILRIQAKSVLGIGALQQLIEDHPFAVMPQMLQTERPDRTAAGLQSGQIAILMDNSPYALILPITIFHLLHATDDSFLRWQYGTLMRIVRMFGLLLSLLLPALYLSVTLYHTHLIPMPLLTSIAETRANVPFPIAAEILFMEASFHLLNEAGMRMPRQIGSALGIVGALILGQAAVSASIISPILIIIVALTGLGTYATPDYSFGMGIIIYRTLLILLSAFMGLYGVMLGMFFIALQLCSLESFGVKYLSPVAPHHRHNPDIIARLPIWMQRRAMFFASQTRIWGGDSN